MSPISHCPSCGKQVSVPLGAPPTARVRCPLCHTEFPLQAALDLAPPALVLVESAGHEFGAASDMGGESLGAFAHSATETPEAPFGQSVETMTFDYHAPAGHDANQAFGEVIVDEAQPIELDSLNLESSESVESDDLPIDLGHGALEDDALELDDMPSIAASDEAEQTLEFPTAIDEPLDLHMGEPSSLNTDELNFDAPPDLEDDAEIDSAGSMPPPGELVADDHEPLSIPVEGFSDDSFAEQPAEELDLTGEYIELDQEEDLPAQDIKFNEPLMGVGGDTFGDSGSSADFGSMVDDAPQIYREPPADDDEIGFDTGEDTAFGEETPFGFEEEGDEPQVAMDDDLELEEREVGAPARAVASAPDSLDLKATPRKKKRKPNMIISLVMGLLSSVVGLGGGYLVLLWVLGAKGDLLHIGGMMPAFMVPAEFHQQQVAKVNPPAPQTDNGATTPEENENTENGGDAATPPVNKTPAETTETPDDMADPAPLTSKTPKATEEPDDATEMPDEPADKASPASVAEETPDKMPDEPATEESDPLATPPAKPKPLKPNPKASVPAETEVASEMPEDDDPLATPDEPPAKAKPADTADVPAPEELPGLLQPPHFVLIDFEDAMKEAEEAGKALTAASGADAKKAKANFYRKLYRLAGVATFVEEDAPSWQGHADDLQQFVQGLIAGGRTPEEMDGAGTQWMKSTKREQDGVALAGTIKRSAKQGGAYETTLVLAGDAPEVTVLSAEDPGVAAGEKVVVLGSIVQDAPNKLKGIQTDKEKVIWSRLLLKTQ